MDAQSAFQIYLFSNHIYHSRELSSQVRSTQMHFEKDQYSWTNNGIGVDWHERKNNLLPKTVAQSRSTFYTFKSRSCVRFKSRNKIMKSQTSGWFQEKYQTVTHTNLQKNTNWRLYRSIIINELLFVLGDVKLMEESEKVNQIETKQMFGEKLTHDETRESCVLKLATISLLTVSYIQLSSWQLRACWSGCQKSGWSKRRNDLKLQTHIALSIKSERWSHGKRSSFGYGTVIAQLFRNTSLSYDMRGSVCAWVCVCALHWN